MKTIKSKRDFEVVFMEGKRVSNRFVNLVVRPVVGDGAPRVAFVAAKRLGNAVHRNRCKRVLRSAARQAGYPLAGYEVILLSPKATHDASSREVAAALGRLAKRFGV